MPQFTLLDPTTRAQSPAVVVTPYEGLTLILACRNESRALAARQQILDDLDAHIQRERRRPGYNGHAERFRDNLEVQIHIIDMGDLKSVFRFGREVSQKYAALLALRACIDLYRLS